MYELNFFFFFSSRRRHTRFDCDWSSDVCSSDLAALRPVVDDVRNPFDWEQRASVAGMARLRPACGPSRRSEEHTSELQSQSNLVCRLLLEKKNPEPIPKRADDQLVCGHACAYQP